MTKLIYFICFVLYHCAFAVDALLNVLQPETAVRVQPGSSTTLQCNTPDDGHFTGFWLKFQNISAPAVVAMAQSNKAEILMGELFQDPSKYRVTWNQPSFNLTFLNVEQTDIAVYFCGTVMYKKMYFGNGTKLMFESTHFNGTEAIKEKEDNWREQLFVYVVLILVTITVVSILLNTIQYHILKKIRAGMSQSQRSQEQETEDVNYAALTFTHKQRKTKQKLRKECEPRVIYGPVRQQES
ncbi:uncharacterized protein LOC127444911 [Myxocyprinus asiaticus]|uniref:uncharacterized protein LOC127444911 n=1 Tax=Myxocyprinus asiaticus TaxID=70543 RepID=UPI002223B87C|nr:uncharacterized protein LOC127444911 [Myxocyprinus asiaticus]